MVAMKATRQAATSNGERQECAAKQPPKVFAWWRKDMYGWPIERFTNRSRFSWWLRVVLQNIRKVTG